MIDFNQFPSPCYIMEEELLRKNLCLIKSVADRAGVEIILAFKSFAMWRSFPIFREYIDHSTASSVYEARLALEEFGSKAHTYSPAYTEQDFPEIMRCSSHITFNSMQQFERFYPMVVAEGSGISCGIRVNPEYSEVETELYNPCAPGTRFGITADLLPEALPQGIEGFHCHCHCESSSYELERTLEHLEAKFAHWFPQIKWLNLGGGHLMTRKDYDTEHLIRLLQGLKARYPHLRIILEPGSAFTWQTVIAYCDQLQEMGYRLEPDYKNNFAVFNEPSVENIFTIPMNKTLYTNQMQYLFRSRHYNHAKAYGLSGENGPSATIEALETFGYETAQQDPRFDICYFAGVVYDLKGNIVRLDDGTVLEYLPWKVELDISNTPYEQTAGARMKKYEVDETATKDGKLMENDIVLFRYADVLLMKSEAKIRNGEVGDAELNEVRGRVNASSRTATLENILAERQLELAWEGWRRQDLIRFGAFTRAYSSRPQLPDENNGYTTVFPIPEKIRVMNTKLEQNPGY